MRAQRTPIRRRFGRAACTAAMVTLAWSATGGPVVSAAPAVSNALVGLRQGSKGNEVKALQQALIAAGIPVAGGADGVFGPATKRALVAFQKARGLSASGEVDQATSSALASASSSTTTSSSTNPYVGLSEGAKGDAVKVVQEKLIKFGVYLSSGANGVWGSAVTRGVKQFQGWNGLTQTGTINTATAKKLGLSGSSTTSDNTSSTAATNSSNGYVGLKQGANGALVKDLQKALMSSGIVVPGGADGVFGPATTTALKAFQGFNGLTKNGVVSEKTAALLKLGSGSSSTTPPAASSTHVGLKIGARGQSVVDVQKALIAAGVPVRGGADGVFGNATKSALLAYQQAVGISQSGVVDQATADKLGLGSSRAPVPFASTNNNDSSTPPASSNAYVGLKAGASGPLVKELQQALMNTGLVVRGGADGAFGPATTSSLKAFQKVNGGSQTGVVSERDAKILALGTGTVQPASNPSSANIKLERFPVQGQCFFGDTWGAARGGGRLHEGVDVIAAEGKLLYAVVDGTVSKLYWDQPGALSGNGLRVAQANGTYFTYLHMLGFAPGVKVGTKVEAGDVIGFVGNTGASATPHLHFEVHPNGGGAVNPYPFIKAIDGCKDSTPQYQGTFE